MELKQCIKGEGDFVNANVICGHKEFAKSYKITRQTLQKLQSRGLPVHVCGKTHVYFHDQVEAWMKKNLRVQNVNIKP